MSHRTCIAVGTEQMVQKTVDAEISPAAQLCEEIKETPAAAVELVETEKADGAAGFMEKVSSVYKACAERVKGYFVFDTVIGKEKAKGTFSHKCASGVERVKHYFGARAEPLYGCAGRQCFSSCNCVCCRYT